MRRKSNPPNPKTEDPKITEIFNELEKLRAGRRAEVDVIRLLEICALFGDTRQYYGASMAAGIANQAVRPPF